MPLIQNLKPKKEAVMELLSVFAIGFIGALTPGPDILFVLRTSLCNGARAAFSAFLGIASGWAIFLGALYLGLGLVLGSAEVQSALMLCGGVYLAYLAYALLTSQAPVLPQTSSHTRALDASRPRALLGFYLKALGINLSNPKAILFFGTIIVPFMEVDLGARIGVLFCALSLPFLGVIALGGAIGGYLTPKVFVWIDRICGVVFAGFSAYLLYTSLGAWWAVFGG